MSEPRNDRGDVVAALRAADRALLEHAQHIDPLRPLLPTLTDADRALGELPPPAMGEELAAALDGRRPRRWSLALVAPLPVAAAVAALLLWRGGAPAPGEPSPTLAAAPPPACARLASDDGEVAVAGEQRCLVQEERYQAVLAPGARLALGPLPRVQGDVEVRPTAAPVIVALLEPARGQLVVDAPLRLLVRPAAGTSGAEAVVLQGSAALLTGDTTVSRLATRVFTVGERLTLDAPTPVATTTTLATTTTTPATDPTTPATDAAAPRPTNTPAAARPPAATTTAMDVPDAAPSDVEDDVGSRRAGSAALPSLLARARAARLRGDVTAALALVDAALAQEASRRTRVILGFERAQLLGLRGDVLQACTQLRAIEADAAAAHYEETIADERDDLGCR
jgi:hypothetical protein